MFALADANNFYASCETVFRPDLRGKPIVVVSNNDGCVISPPSRWWSVIPTMLLRSRSSGPCAGSVKSTSQTRSSCSGISSRGGSVSPAVSKIKWVSRLASPRRHARASMPRPVSQCAVTKAVQMASLSGLMWPKTCITGLSPKREVRRPGRK